MKNILVILMLWGSAKAQTYNYTWIKTTPTDSFQLQFKQVDIIDDSLVVLLPGRWGYKIPKTVFQPTTWGTNHTHAYSTLTSIPSSFTPSAHTHPYSDLTGLTLSNDDFLQRKAGAWANRTIAQVKVDLGLSGTNTGDQTLNGLLPTQTGNNGKYLTTDGANATWGTPAGSGTVTNFIFTNGNGVNGSVTTSTTTPTLSLSFENNTILAYRDLGSPLWAQTVDFPLTTCNVATALVDGQCKWIGVYLNRAQTITGVRVYVRTLGAYTGDNNNRVGLYSYNSGTLTLVASSANSASLWTSAANAFQTIAFSGTYSASQGIYFVCLLYNQSAQTTAPALAGGTALNNAAMANILFTNSAKLYGTSNATDLPASIAMSSITASTAPNWVGLY